jgi:hypothetical protein
MYARTYPTPFGNLTILADDALFFNDEVLTFCQYQCPLASEEFTILITAVDKHYPACCYRAETFSQGLYIGHHLGLPGSIMFSPSGINLSIPGASIPQLRKLFWCYALKVYLTLMAQKYGALHLKGTVVGHRNGKAMLLLGRGGGGKTTLSRFLQQHGMEILSNTHAIVVQNKVWPVPCWIRVRDEQGVSHYIQPGQTSSTSNPLTLTRLLWVSWNSLEQFEFRDIPAELAFSQLLYYSLASINYDLKEDLYDFSPSDFAGNSATEVAHLNELTQTLPCYSLNWDKSSSQVAVKVLAALGSGQ